MSNPYEPPVAETDLPSSDSRKSLGWRVYAVVNLLLFVANVLQTLARSNPKAAIVMGVGLVAAVGIAGFAWNRRLLAREIWKFWWWLYPALQLFHIAPALPDAGETGSDNVLLVVLVSIAWMAPGCLALFRYQRSDVWREPR